MSKKYDVQEVFNLLGEDVLNATEPVIKSDSIKVDGYLVYKDSWRYRTFYQKGLKCACCGREGSYFKLKADSNNLKSSLRHQFRTGSRSSIRRTPPTAVATA